MTTTNAVPPAELFRLVDSMDPEQFAALLAGDATLTFANGPASVGTEAIIAGCAAFNSTIKGLQHTIVNEWHQGHDSVVELSVTCHRLDGRAVTIPAVSIWTRNDDGLIAKYRVYVDLEPVYA